MKKTSMKATVILLCLMFAAGCGEIPNIFSSEITTSSSESGYITALETNNENIESSDAAPPQSEAPEASPTEEAPLSTETPDTSVSAEEQAVPVAEGLHQPPKTDAVHELTYVEQRAHELAWSVVTPDMSEYEKVKTLFDYMIESTSLAQPVGLEMWRILGNYDEPPNYLENRALSVLLYNVGMCEDYAAAFTMLLRAVGLEAEYVEGLTYSAEGFLVDHYWTKRH